MEYRKIFQCHSWREETTVFLVYFNITENNIDLFLYQQTNHTVNMDVVYAVKKYITDMIDQAGPGMKVLLMDNETVSQWACDDDDSIHHQGAETNSLNWINQLMICMLWPTSFETNSVHYIKFSNSTIFLILSEFQSVYIYTYIYIYEIIREGKGLLVLPTTHLFAYYILCIYAQAFCSLGQASGRGLYHWTSQTTAGLQLCNLDWVKTYFTWISNRANTPA